MRSRDTRFRTSLIVSVVLHAALLMLVGYAHPRPEPPEERVLQVELRSLGHDPAEVAGGAAAVEQPVQTPAPQPVPSPQPQPQPQPQPAPRPQPARPPQPEAPPVPQAPAGEVAKPAPPSQPSQPPPRSFSEWRSQRMGRLASAVSRAVAADPGGGSPDGSDRLTSRGKDKCEPPGERRVDLVYLLFDSSGSMDSFRQRQALTCAHQYAKAALESGARVVVGNFAGTTVFSPPTRDMTDVEFALRGGSNPHATILPSKELNPFLDQDPGTEADLIIVSDGFIANYRDVLPWYRYFLELNAENRGMMFTVGSQGHPDVLQAFRSIGFDIYVYRII